jgi:uncharacterized protein
MIQAMKAKDEAKLSTARMLKTALMKWKADNMKDPDEPAELAILNSLVKQRREAADAFRKAGREDQAAKEEAESKLIEGYMPAAPTAEEIEAAIAAAIAETGVTSQKQMGLVMKAVQAKLTGKRLDGKALSDQIRGRLA